MRSGPDRPQRRSIRLPGYDYALSGAYFVTICMAGHECLLGEVVGDEMHLSALGEIVRAGWQAIPVHSAHVLLDSFVVMPNHLHGILVLAEDACRGEASPRTGAHLQPAHGDASPPPYRPAGAPAGSLGAFVGNFKSVTSRRINHLRGTPGAPVWQRNYYEHVIRDQEEWNRIREYIRSNPARWALDRENPTAARQHRH